MGMGTQCRAPVSTCVQENSGVTVSYHQEGFHRICNLELCAPPLLVCELCHCWLFQCAHWLLGWSIFIKFVDLHNITQIHHDVLWTMAKLSIVMRWTMTPISDLSRWCPTYIPTQHQYLTYEQKLMDVAWSFALLSWRSWTSPLTCTLFRPCKAPTTPKSACVTSQVDSPKTKHMLVAQCDERGGPTASYIWSGWGAHHIG